MATYSRKGPTHDEQGREYDLTCASCDRETTHLVLCSAEFIAEWREREFSVDDWNEYQILECRGCHSVSFRQCSRSSEDIEVDPDTGDQELVRTVTLYPRRLEGRKELQHAVKLPATVRGIYQETLEALTNGLPILTGIGIRALVETICRDKKTKGRTLESKLDDLVSKGVVTQDGAEILHGLRIMGNKAAHEVVPSTLTDLNIAFEVIEHALQGVYVLPRLAERLPRRPGSSAP